MSDNFNWNDGQDTDNYSEYDAIQDTASPPRSRPSQNIEPYMPEPTIPAKPNNPPTNVLSEARIRLEQGRLYEMIFNHDLFEGVDAHPTAIENVQNELRDFILYRLEILLGIKKEVAPVTESESFNEVEIDFLKQLSATGTKGESLKAPSKGLKPLVSSPIPSPYKSSPSQVNEEPAPSPKLRGRPPKRKKNMTVEDYARQDIQDMVHSNHNKPTHEMNSKELKEANKKVQSNRRVVKNKNAKNKPTDQQIEQFHRQNLLANASNNPLANLNQTLAQHIINKKS